MNSSGIKRGLATTAVSALAIAGLPLFASSASATPLSAQAPGANKIELLAPSTGAVSQKNDGTNTSVSLAVNGGANVTSVLFQYETAAAPGTWVDVPNGLVGRGADGLFTVDWASVPATLTQVRAVPNTDNGLGSETVTAATVNVGNAANTVELSSEGALGAFTAPYTDNGNAGTFIGARGTASEAGVGVTVEDPTGTAATSTVTAEDADGVAGGTAVFSAKLDITGYTPSGAGDPDQIALRAVTDAFGGNAATDDVEASTLYSQVISSIDAAPATQEQVDPTASEIVVSVKDQRGNPIAGAEIGIVTGDNGTPNNPNDDPFTILGSTDGNGEYLDAARTTAGTFKYYVNTTDADIFESAVDLTDSAVVTTYSPVATAVEIVNRRNRAAFDLDELSDADDFRIRTLDQRGKVFEEDLTGSDIEYRWIIDPTAAGAPTITSNWIGAETTAGVFDVPALTDTVFQGFPNASGDLPAGTYRLEARRPSTTIGGQPINATAVSFNAGEAEISYAEGASLNSPVNGDTTVVGKLALADGTVLAGRKVSLTLTGAGDSSFAAQAEQPAGTTRTTPTAAVAITAADGSFSVKIDDPAVPVNVTPVEESRTLNAIADGEAQGDGTSLQGNNGADDSATANDPANAEQDIVVNFVKAATVGRIAVTFDEVFGGAPAPGKPVELNVVVYGTDSDTDPNNDPILKDYPVSFSADKGFFSPDSVAGLNSTADDLTLDAAQDDEGDLFGFYQSLGASEEVSTGDAGAAGIIAAIERDEDFDDDGLSEMTVTVTAGGVSKDVTVEFDARNYLNLQNVSLERAEGEPAGDVTVGDSVDFQLYAEDQFGNLVGDQLARISDDTADADVQTDSDFGQTLTDFENDNAGITATASAPTIQTLMARLSNVAENLVDADGDLDAGSRTVTESAEPITWKDEVVVPPKQAVTALIAGEDNGGKKDVIRFQVDDAAEGATVQLFKIKRKDGKRVLVQVREAIVPDGGELTFKIADKNGNRITRYVAEVSETETTLGDTSNVQKLR